MKRSSLSSVGHYAALAAVLAGAALLRFFGLSQRGFIYWDEGKFALEGIRLQAALIRLLGGTAPGWSGKTVGTAKPMHAVFLAAGYALFGVHDYAALYVDAACGVLGVGLTYCLGRYLFGPRAGLGAAVLLATSEYDVIYARSALSETDAVAVFLLAAVVWLVGADPRRAAGTPLVLGPGLLLGLAISTNYRLVVYAGVLVAIDLAVRLPRRMPTRWVGTAGAWAIGLVAPLVVWQLLGTLAEAHGFPLFRSELTGGPASYLSELRFQLHGGKQSAVHFVVLPYLQWWAVRQGPIATILLLIGFILAFRRRGFPWIAPTALVLLPFIAYVFAPFNVPRNLTPALPFAAILAAAALADLPSWWPVRQRAATVLLVGAALLGFGMSWRLTGVQSGFAAASRYVAHAGGLALTTSEVLVFYDRGGRGGCTAPAVPTTRPDLGAYIRAGYTYLVSDRHHKSLVKEYVRRLAPEAARFPAQGRVNMNESLISSENSNPPELQPRSEWVIVYRIDHVPARRLRGGTVRPCRRNVVT